MAFGHFWKQDPSLGSRRSLRAIGIARQGLQPALEVRKESTRERTGNQRKSGLGFGSACSTIAHNEIVRSPEYVHRKVQEFGRV